MKKTLLLVEDNLAHAELIKRSLERVELDIETHHVTDGEEALEFIKTKMCPHLILLDLKLPKLSGKSVLKYLKNHELFKKIPVVILTTSISSDDIKEAYLNYANSYLVKPANFIEFQKMIEKTCNYWLKCNLLPW